MSDPDPRPTLAATLRLTCELFKNAGLPDADQSARHLLAACRNQTATELIGSLQESLIPVEQTRFEAMVARRLRREPLWYIVGQMPYGKLNLHADQRVLIPRPETELLIQLTVEYLLANQQTVESLIDVGTGTGAIVLSIANQLAEAGIDDLRLTATDSSPDALIVAEHNAITNHLFEAVTFIEADLLRPQAGGPALEADVLVANLPYIPTGRLASLSPEVINFEPTLALDGGDDGLDLFRRLFQQITSLGQPPQRLFLEIDESQGDKIGPLCRSYLPHSECVVRHDLAGRPRYALIDLDR